MKLFHKKNESEQPTEAQKAGSARVLKNGAYADLIQAGAIIKTAFCGSFLDSLRVAQQDDTQHIAGQKTAGGTENAGIGALSKHDGAGIFLQLVLEAFKNVHQQYTSDQSWRVSQKNSLSMSLF